MITRTSRIGMVSVRLVVLALLAAWTPGASEARQDGGRGLPPEEQPVETQVGLAYVDDTEFIHNELIVVFPDQPDFGREIATIQFAGCESLGTLSEHIHHCLVISGEPVFTAINILVTINPLDPFLIPAESAAPNFVDQFEQHLTEPNDTQYARQWALNNRGAHHFNGARERYYDRAGGTAMAFDANDTIVDDVDNSMTFTAGDRLLRGAAPAIGDALRNFTNDENHINTPIFKNGLYDDPETVYNDLDMDGKVSLMDDRLTPFGATPAGAVAMGDPDLGLDLFRFRVVTGDALLGTIDADIDGPQAWEFGTDCSAVTIAVIDTGVDFTHPDLAGTGDPNSRSFAGRMMYVDTNGNDQFDGGERVVLDQDGSGTFTPGDSVVGAGGAPANEAALVRFFAGSRTLFETIHDNDGDRQFTDGEGIYEDRDFSRTVTAGDIRVRPPTAPAAHAGLGAGVVGADADRFLDPPANTMPTPLRRAGLNAAGAVRVRHADPDLGRSYTDGERIYIDANNNNLVDAGDTRLIAIGGGPGVGAVAAADDDTGTPLVNFGFHYGYNERYHDANNNNVYDANEAIYNDRDNNLMVSVPPVMGMLGDRRLLAPAAGTPGNNTNVTTPPPAQGDIGNALKDFPTDIESAVQMDSNGHGTAVSGVAAARGNNNQDIAGVCWQGRIMALQTNFARTSTAKCIGHVRTRLNAGDNVRVVNMSLGGYGFDDASERTIDNMDASLGGFRGALFTIAASNEARDNDFRFSSDPFSDAGMTWEGVYRVANALVATVAAGQTRLTRVGPLLPPGVVGAMDADAGQPLRSFFRVEKHVDDGPTANRYDAGELSYLDLDLSGTVTANDFRLCFFRAPGMVVASFGVGRGRVLATDPDAVAATALVRFQATEKYVDGGTDDGGRLNAFDGAGPAFPAAFTALQGHVLSVAASTDRDRLASFSNYGKVWGADFAAPGENVLVLRPSYRFSGAGATQQRTRFTNGTSYSAPYAAGAAALYWSRPGIFGRDPQPFWVALRLKTGQEFGPLGTPHPHGVDPRAGIMDLVQSGLMRDGRLRLVAAEDFGDAPDAPFPTLLASAGPTHEDIGEEWLGRKTPFPLFWFFPPLPPALQPPRATDVSPEWDAANFAALPPDPDGIANLIDDDFHDDGVELIGPFFFNRAGLPNQVAQVRVYIDTRSNGVIDADSGRYPEADGMGPHMLGTVRHLPGATPGVHAAADDKHVYVNAWFDWNRDGDFMDPNEHVFDLVANPRLWAATSTGAVFELYFNMPPIPAGFQVGPLQTRFRLDYAENSGQAIPVPGTVALNAVGPVRPPGAPGARVRYWDTAGPGSLPIPPVVPRFNKYESIRTIPPGTFLFKGTAQFGEVEDHFRPFCCEGDSDGNRIVEFLDITYTLSYWGTNWGPASGPGDSDCNGVVNFADIASTLANWQLACP